MGGIVSGITDAIGLTDSGAGQQAAQASTQAAQIAADYQEKALNYLIEQDELPSAIRESVLPTLAATYGVPGYTGGVDTEIDQGELIQQAKESPLYSALMSGQQAGEESILRQSAATGGLRSGNVQEALADYSTQLQNQALSQAYDQQLSLKQSDINRQIGGLSSLAGLDSYASQIAGQTSNIGQTLAQGQTAAAQALMTGSQQNTANLLGLGQLGVGVAGLFSDKRLKTNIRFTGNQNGYPTYRWDWNEKAADLGLFGSGYGTIADEIEDINPDAVSTRDGYKTVNYNLIGVEHG